MGKKILIVDDDPEISSLVQYTLESAGHQTQICENGRDVMDTLRDFKPDLIVLDVMLPGTDGFSLTTEITEDEDLSSIPIIILSALEPSRPMFQRFTQVTAFLSKPFNTDDLLETIKTALTNSV